MSLYSRLYLGLFAVPGPDCMNFSVKLKESLKMYMQRTWHVSIKIAHILIQGSRNPLARSPRRVQTTSGLVGSQEVLVRWATNLF